MDKEKIIAVHCPTKDCWDKVQEYTERKYDSWDKRKERSYIELKSGSYCHKGYFTERPLEYQMISFEEFERRFLEEDKKESEEDALLRQANERYPIGTKYRCAHDNSECEVEEPFDIYDAASYYNITDGCGGYVYYRGEWATIIESTAEPKDEEKKSKVFNDWSEEEKIAEVKRRYPIGTAYRCPSLGVKMVTSYCHEGLRFGKSGDIDAFGAGFFYFDNKWSEIIKQPKDEGVIDIDYYNRKYPMGTIYKCASTGETCMVKGPLAIAYHDNLMVTDGQGGAVYYGGYDAPVIGIPAPEQVEMKGVSSQPKTGMISVKRVEVFNRN